MIGSDFEGNARADLLFPPGGIPDHHGTGYHVPDVIGRGLPRLGPGVFGPTPAWLIHTQSDSGGPQQSVAPGTSVKKLSHRFDVGRVSGNNARHDRCSTSCVREAPDVWRFRRGTASGGSDGLVAPNRREDRSDAVSPVCAAVSVGCKC
jgi:hypothetical protein